MSLITTIAPDKANGKVAEVYAGVNKVFGRVPNAVRVYSVSPGLLEVQWAGNAYYLRHPNLPFTLLATIRMLVSQENKCDYCIGLNGSMLMQRAGWTLDQINATKHNPDMSPLSEKEKAMLKLVLKSVNDRLPISRAEIDKLLQLGWTESDVLDAVAHGARNVMVDIVFNTFQIEQDF